MVDTEMFRRDLETLLLYESYEVISARNEDVIYQSCPERVQQEPPDLALVETSVSQSKGLLALDKLRSCEITKAIPVILVSEACEREDFRKAMEAGADDFVSKPFSSYEILRAVATRLKRRVEISVGTWVELENLKEQLNRLERYNALTGLPNSQSLDIYLSRLKTQGIIEPVTLFYIDFDRFSGVNRILGIDKANLVLKELAERIRKNTPPRDELFHLQSETFVLFSYTYIHQKQIDQFAQNLLWSLRKPSQSLTEDVIVTASIGLCQYPGEDRRIEQCVEACEHAMFKGKEMGGNAYVSYSSEMGRHSLKQMHMESQIRLALENGDFSVFYQPKIDLQSNRMVGMESLIRWNHVKAGQISPNFFIPLAEKSGLILPIGTWVMEQSVQEAQKLWQYGYRDFRVSVNVSAYQFRTEELVEQIRSLLQEYGLPGTILDLEITETTFIGNLELVQSQIHELEKMGITISLDDFGTGYSSFAYLHELPIHNIKIDRVFIRKLDYDSHDYGIIKSIVSLAKNMELTVVAEGVETQHQRRLLYELGCDQFQGFLVSEPRPIEELSLHFN